MGDRTAIEWTRGDDGAAGATWNPVTGCTKISAGCDHCYAETFAERWRGTHGHHFEHGFDVTLRPERLDQPLRWKRPRRIFVNSMSDLFHDSVPDEYIAEVFAVMSTARQHTYQVLTKRHGRMRSLLNSDRFRLRVMGLAAARDEYRRSPLMPQSHIWLGVSVEDQKWADIRIPALLETPAAVRFVSAEPLLGPINLHANDDGLHHWLPDYGPLYDDGSGEPVCQAHGVSRGLHGGSAMQGCNFIDWLVAGGESGPGARLCELSWLRSLKDQCANASVPFFCKQLGSVAGREWSAGTKGGTINAFPEDLRVREFPRAAESVSAR